MVTKRRKASASAVRRRVKRHGGGKRVSHKKLKPFLYSRKYARKTVRNVMTGGGVSKIKNFEGTYADGAVTLSTRKTIFTRNPQLVIEVNLSGDNNYNGDILHLLNSLLVQLSGDPKTKLLDTKWAKSTEKEPFFNTVVLDNPNFARCRKININNIQSIRRYYRREQNGKERHITKGVYDDAGNPADEKFLSGLEPTKKPTKCKVVIELTIEGNQIKIKKIILSSPLVRTYLRVFFIYELYGEKEREFAGETIECWTIGKEVTEEDIDLTLSKDSIDLDKLIQQFVSIKEIQLLETEEQKKARLNDEEKQAEKQANDEKLRTCGFTDFITEFDPLIESHRKLQEFFEREGQTLNGSYFYRKGFKNIYKELVNKYLTQDQTCKGDMERILQTLHKKREDWQKLRERCSVGVFSNEGKALGLFGKFLQSDNNVPVTFDSVSYDVFKDVFKEFDPDRPSYAGD